MAQDGARLSLMKADDGLGASNRLHAYLDLVTVSDRVED
jgi:hypothetical protein